MHEKVKTLCQKGTNLHLILSKVGNELILLENRHAQWDSFGNRCCMESTDFDTASPKNTIFIRGFLNKCLKIYVTHHEPNY